MLFRENSRESLVYLKILLDKLSYDILSSTKITEIILDTNYKSSNM